MIVPSVAAAIMFKNFISAYKCKTTGHNPTKLACHTQELSAEQKFTRRKAWFPLNRKRCKHRKNRSARVVAPES